MKPLGDRLADIIQRGTFGTVKPCMGCQERKEWVNKQEARFKDWLRQRKAANNGR